MCCSQPQALRLNLSCTKSVQPTGMWPAHQVTLPPTPCLSFPLSIQPLSTVGKGKNVRGHRHFRCTAPTHSLEDTLRHVAPPDCCCLLTRTSSGNMCVWGTSADGTRKTMMAGCHRSVGLRGMHSVCRPIVASSMDFRHGQGVGLGEDRVHRAHDNTHSHTYNNSAHQATHNTATVAGPACMHSQMQVPAGLLCFVAMRGTASNTTSCAKNQNEEKKATSAAALPGSRHAQWRNILLHQARCPGSAKRQQHQGVCVCARIHHCCQCSLAQAAVRGLNSSRPSNTHACLGPFQASCRLNQAAAMPI